MFQYHTIPVTTFQQNCSLVWCDETREGAVIGPGGDLDRIMQVVSKRNLTLVAIWLTHAHIDHAGAAGELAAKLDLPILGPHEADQFWIDKLVQQSAMFGFPEAKPFTPPPLAARRRRCPNFIPGHGPESTFGSERKTNTYVADR